MLGLVWSAALVGMSGILHVALLSPWVCNVQSVQSDVIPVKLIIPYLVGNPLHDGAILSP